MIKAELTAIPLPWVKNMNNHPVVLSYPSLMMTKDISEEIILPIIKAKMIKRMLPAIRHISSDITIKSILSMRLGINRNRTKY